MANNTPPPKKKKNQQKNQANCYKGRSLSKKCLGNYYLIC